MITQELFEKLRYIPSGLGCMDECCEGCAYEEKERKEVEEQIVTLVRKETIKEILNCGISSSCIYEDEIEAWALSKGVNLD